MNFSGDWLSFGVPCSPTSPPKVDVLESLLQVLHGVDGHGLDMWNAGTEC